MFPNLVNRSSAFLAPVLADIINTITTTGNWPKIWKTEYATPIPKKAVPESLDDIRNISCTQFFSKTYENFVLNWLNQQVEIRTNKYGGRKGSGSEHFLVELWQSTLESLEDQRAGVLLSSIDFAKAFNRLDFAWCLESLKSKGACTQLIKVVSSFLENRTMMVKVGNTMSNPRPVLGGVPQGSRLGVLLFYMAIDNFEAHSDDVKDYSPTDNYRLTDPAPGRLADAPVRAEPHERDYLHLPPWRQELLTVLKYVDDNIFLKKLNFDSVMTGPDASRVKHALRTQNLHRWVVFEAESRGMRVNAKKTMALLISELKNYVPKAYFVVAGGNQLVAGDSIKVLGFEFGQDPNMAAQVAAIKRKFYARKWILNHLGYSGFSKVDLLRVYRSVLLPVHDYFSCVYNSSLTQTQSSALERLQAQALKTIYGYEFSYRQLLEMTGLQTLEERRKSRDVKFAWKAAASTRFRSWFPLQPISRATRRPLTYREDFAKTKRLNNSPLYHMRRLLNGGG